MASQLEEGEIDLNSLDSDGNITEVIDEHTEKMSHYDQKGKLVFYHIVTYDDNRRIIHKTAYTGGGTVEDGSYDFTYTDDGKLKEGAWYFWSSGYLMKTENFYDENGRCVDQYWHGSKAHNVVGNRHYLYYLEDGRIDYVIYYSTWREDGTHDEPDYEYRIYNDEKQLIRIDAKDKEGVLLNYRVYKYNEQGLKSDEIYYKADDTIDFRYEYSYDENGKATEERRYDKDGNLVSTDKY